MSCLPFGLPVCLSRSLSLSLTDSAFLKKNSHTHSYLGFFFFFYLVSITLVGQPTLKKPFDFDHASISAPLGTLIQMGFFLPPSSSDALYSLQCFPPPIQRNSDTNCHLLLDTQYFTPTFFSPPLLLLLFFGFFVCVFFGKRLQLISNA